MGIDCKARFNLYPPVTMTYREYIDRQDDIVNAYNNGEMNLPDMQSKLAELDKEFKELENSRPASTFDNWTERAEEATRKMKERMHEIRTKWAHAYIYGDKVKIRTVRFALS